MISSFITYHLFYVDNVTCVGVISSFIASFMSTMAHVLEWYRPLSPHVDNGTCVGVISSFITSFMSTMARVLEWYRPLSPHLRRLWHAYWSDIVLYRLFYVEYDTRVGVISSFITSFMSTIACVLEWYCPLSHLFGRYDTTNKSTSVAIVTFDSKYNLKNNFTSRCDCQLFLWPKLLLTKYWWTVP